MFKELDNAQNDQEDDKAIEGISKLVKTDEEVGQDIQDQANRETREQIHKLVP